VPGRQPSKSRGLGGHGIRVEAESQSPSDLWPSNREGFPDIDVNLKIVKAIGASRRCTKAGCWDSKPPAIGCRPTVFRRRTIGQSVRDEAQIQGVRWCQVKANGLSSFDDAAQRGAGSPIPRIARHGVGGRHGELSPSWASSLLSHWCGAPPHLGPTPAPRPRGRGEPGSQIRRSTG
jgi:hypothetical protein